MDSNDFTSRDLILVLDEAGTAFGWSRAYMAVMATSIGAAFAALGLDESKDSIIVAPADVVDQMAKITESSASLGRAPATGRSYATTWRRLATIAYRWRLEGGAEPGSAFWSRAEDLRDTRPRRLTAKKPSSHHWLAPPGRDTASTLRVDLSTGQAIVELPEGTTAEDLVTLVSALMAHHSETATE